MVQAQDYFEDISKVSEQFTSKYLTVDVEVKMYKSSQARGEIYSHAMLRKKGDKYYSRAGSRETISDGVQSILVDHLNKEVIVFHESKKSQQFDLNSELDQLKKNIDSVEYVGQKNGGTTYIIHNPLELIERTVITFDSQTHYLRKVVYYYNQKDTKANMGMYKSEVIYTRFSQNAPSESVYDLKKYIRKRAEKTELAESYKDYTLTVAGL